MFFSSKNDIILQDPLQEAVKSRLPEFAHKLGIDHFSPTQFTLADGAWLFKYVVLTQKMRRELLESNSSTCGYTAQAFVPTSASISAEEVFTAQDLAELEAAGMVPGEIPFTPLPQ